MPAPTTRASARRRPRKDRRARTRPGRDGAAGGGADKARETLKDNLKFWAKAIVVILLLRALIFEPFRIPSESMEDTLLVGDFLIVSKLHYGARTPSTIGVPLTSIYVPGIRLPQTRLPGFSDPQRGDVAVFNYPASVDIERGAIGSNVPVERRAPYIKRLTGMPGDTLAIVDKVLFVNGAPVPISETMRQRWRAFTVSDTRPLRTELDELGIDLLDETVVRDTVGSLQFDVVANPGGAETLRAMPEIDRVEPVVLPTTAHLSEMTQGISLDFLYDPARRFNPDQWGPIRIPHEGMTVVFDEATWTAYADVIDQYEGRSVGRATGGGFLIDGQSVSDYTFEQDYFFAMGDNRDNSVDSRYWGFVPKSHLVGKAVFKFISLEWQFPPIPRFERFFRPIH